MMLPHATSTAPAPATTGATAARAPAPAPAGATFTDALGAATSQATDGDVGSSQTPDEFAAERVSGEHLVADGAGSTAAVDAAPPSGSWTSWVLWSLLGSPVQDTAGQDEAAASSDIQHSGEDMTSGDALALGEAAEGIAVSPAGDVSGTEAIVSAITPAVTAAGEAVPGGEPATDVPTSATAGQPHVAPAGTVPAGPARREVPSSTDTDAPGEALAPNSRGIDEAVPTGAGTRPHVPMAAPAAEVTTAPTPSSFTASTAAMSPPGVEPPVVDNPPPPPQGGEAEPSSAASAVVGAVAAEVPVAPKAELNTAGAEPVVTAAANAPARTTLDPLSPATPDVVPTTNAEAADAVLDQVVKSLRLQWKNGLGEARILLRPEHLGPVNITLKVDAGAVTAIVRAESAQVQEWIVSHQHTLRQQLEAAGLTLDGLVVSPDGERRRQGEAEAQAQQRARTRRRVDDEDATLPRFEVVV